MENLDGIDLLNIDLDPLFQPADQMLQLLNIVDKNNVKDISSKISKMVENDEMAEELCYIFSNLYSLRCQKHDCYFEILNNVIKVNENIPEKIKYFGISLDEREFKDKFKLFKDSDITFQCAIMNDNIDYLRSLMQMEGFQIEKTYKLEIPVILYGDEFTPIDLAAFFGSVNCFKHLLLHKAKLTPNVNLLAIAGGNIEIIRLVEQNIHDKFSDGALSIAAYYYRPEVFNWLLNHLELMTDDANKKPPYYVFLHSFLDRLNKLDFIGRHFYRVQQFLLEFANPINYKEILLRASASGALPLIKYTLPNVDRRTAVSKEKKRNPLHLAACADSVACVRYLLQSGYSAKTVDGEGLNALQVAAVSGSSGVVRFFEGAGADLSAEYSKSSPLLVLAVESQNAELVEYLLERQTPTRGTRNRETPLHRAVSVGNEGIVGILVEGGQSLEARDEVGRMPIHIAAERGNSRILKMVSTAQLLRAKDAYGNYPIHYAAKSKSAECVKLCAFSTFWLDINVRNNDGCTPLDIAHGEAKDLLTNWFNEFDGKCRRECRKEYFARQHGKVYKMKDQSKISYTSSEDYEEDEEEEDEEY